uniref:Ig-like domain-containing protein n=1 Tax=Podarcis muralis TaxID=64176 RepID=A0A670JZL4_PODMU
MFLRELCCVHIDRTRLLVPRKEADIIQSHKSHIRHLQRAQRCGSSGVWLCCEQKYQHNVMFWYRQGAEPGLQLLFHYYYAQQQPAGNVSDRFTADMPSTDRLILNISPAKPEDSAVYFCASSRDTAVQSNLSFLQNPLCYITTMYGPM